MSWQARKGMGQMCASVITVIAPFSSSTLRDGWSAPSGHACRHERGNCQPWQGLRGGESATGGETQKSLSRVCVCVCGSSAIFVPVSISLVTFFSLTSCPSVSVPLFQLYISFPWVQLLQKYTEQSLNARDYKISEKGDPWWVEPKSNYIKYQKETVVLLISVLEYVCVEDIGSRRPSACNLTPWGWRKGEDEGSGTEEQGVSQAGLKCASLIVKQHVVIATANGERNDEKERGTKEMMEKLQVKNYFAEKLSKSPGSAALHWSQISASLSGGI